MHKTDGSSTKHSIIHKRKVNANNKSCEQYRLLKDVEVCNVVSKKLRYLTLDCIRKNFVVCEEDTMNSIAFNIHWILKEFAVYKYLMVTFG